MQLFTNAWGGGPKTLKNNGVLLLCLFCCSLFYIKLATPDSLYHVFIPPSLQFILPHSRGSSHGQTRIIRKAYEHDFYIRMMEDNYELWAQLERESGVKLFRWAVGSKNPIRRNVAKPWPEHTDLSYPGLCVHVKKLWLNLREPRMHDFPHYLWLASLRRLPCLWEWCWDIYIFLISLRSNLQRFKKEMCRSKRWNEQ